ncbi:MAG: hypothetical protein JWO22_64 [Frankiales bacterium]|nr:hypothetical protein [Frankiales bacterium]
MMRRAEGADEDGMMLVELLVGMVLMSIISLIVFDGIVGGFKAQRGLQQKGDALTAVRTVAQRVLRQVREATPIHSATAQQLVIAHADNNGGTVCTRWDFVTTGSTAKLTQTVATDTSCSAWGAATTIIDNLDASVLPFGYGHKAQWSAPSGVTVTTIDPATCIIGGTSPVKYSRYCIGTVTLHLTKLVTGHTPVVVDSTIDVRNPS